METCDDCTTEQVQEAGCRGGVCSRAPDPATPSRTIRGKKAQITLTIDPGLLDEIDAAAKEVRLSRAALISYWMNEKLAARRG